MAEVLGLTVQWTFCLWLNTAVSEPTFYSKYDQIVLFLHFRRCFHNLSLKQNVP
jgi:hypothetical protein